MANTPHTPAGDARFDAIAFRVVPLAVFAALAAGCLVAGSAWSVAAAPWPWLVSLALVGLPHGAADLAVSRRMCHGPAAVAGLIALYVTVMAVAGGAFAVAPFPVLLAFLLLSGWHFGAAHADGQTPPQVRRPGALALAALARGAPVLGMPLAAWPQASAGVAGAVTALAGGAVTLTAADVRVAGVALLAVGGAALAAEAWRTRGDPGGPARSRATLVDLATICLLEAVADPLFAVGCYFLGWHAWRQMRLLAPALGCAPIDGPSALAAALWRIHAAALPLLLPTWATMAAAWWALSPAALPRDPHGLAILSLAVYVVVTPSHDLLMDWWRWRQSRSTSAAAPVAPRARLHGIPPGV